MTQMLEPQPGESIYDPTCGTGGMLLSCITELRRQGKEWRNVRLYGQERNLMTSSIARMNCFLHGIEDFHIVRGDTLVRAEVPRGRPPHALRRRARQSAVLDQAVEPRGVRLRPVGPQPLRHAAAGPRRLCLLAAHPVQPRRRRPAAAPSSSRTACSSARKRPRCGASSSKPTSSSASSASGRTSSTTRRWKPASSSAARRKPKARKGRILFINAVNEVTRERAQSFLTDDHIERIVAAYETFKDEPGFTRVATLEEIRHKDGNLSIPLYVGACRDGSERDGEWQLLARSA